LSYIFKMGNFCKLFILSSVSSSLSRKEKLVIKKINY
jgi:hypothetical protein